MSPSLVNLIPTHEFYSPENKFLSQNDLIIKNIKIVLGSGLQRNFAPTALLEEIKNIQVEIKSISIHSEILSVLFVVELAPKDDPINEIGIFYTDEDKDILIAYYSNKNLIEYSSDSRDVELQLVLPPSKPNNQVDTSVVSNFPADIYTETPENIKNVGIFFCNSLETQSSPVMDEKLNFSWTEVIKNEIPFQTELSLIAFDRHPKKNILLFLYKKKNGNEFFFNTYDVVKQELHVPSLSMTVTQKTSERYGIFGRIDEEYIRCYQSHEKGVFCIRLGITDKTNKSSNYGQQYHASYVYDTATLFKLGNNAALGGGKFGSLSTSKLYFETSGVKQGPVCLQAYPISDEVIENPLIDYILPDDCDEDAIIEVIGGFRDCKPITIITETITIEEIEIRKRITIEEIEIKEKITGKVSTEEKTENEIAKEKIVDKEILYSSEKKMPIFIIIKDKGVEEKLKIEQLPIKSISVNRKTVKDENFRGFKDLEPKSNPPEIYKFETIADFNSFLCVNAKTHMLCRIANRTYIFSRNIFKDENAAKFFIYDRVKKSINTYFLPEEIRKLVIKSGMRYYTDTHVVSYNKIIYFVLHLYSKDKNKISTQIIKLETTIREGDEQKQDYTQLEKDLLNKLKECNKEIEKRDKTLKKN